MGRLSRGLAERLSERDRLTAYKSGIDAGYTGKLDVAPDSEDINSEHFIDGLMVGMALINDAEYTKLGESLQQRIDSSWGLTSTIGIQSHHRIIPYGVPYGMGVIHTEKGDKHE